MNRIKHFFSSPILADETLSRRASLLSFMVNLHLVIAVGVAIVYVVVLMERPIFPLMALLSCVPALGMRVLIHRGKVTLAALIFIGLVAAFIPALTFLSGYSVGTVPATAFQFVAIVMAGLLLGGRGAFGFSIFTSAVDGFILYGEANGWYRVDVSRNLQEIWITQTITYTAVAIQLWLANRLIQESFRRALHENEERRAAEASLQLAVDAARLGTWTDDIATGRIDFSRQLMDIYGGQTPDQIYHSVHLEDRERVQQAFASLLSGEQDHSAITHRIVLPNGSVRWIDNWSHLSRDKHGKPARIAGVMMDITDRKLAEQERERLIHELEARNTELEQFTYTVSHDLKAPIITIRGFLGFLEKDALAGNLERLKSDMSRIVEATDKMQRLLNELLELSRIGRLMNPPEEVRFDLIAREAVKLVQGRLEEKHVEVTIAEGMPVVRGDRVRLVEVMQNLVDNAAKFMGNQPSPHIEIGMPGIDKDGKPILFVRDNGIGIEPQYHERIFGLFNKLDAQTEGTGVGLALVKRIVEVHGGRIWVESEGAGKGATFLFTLAPR